MNCYLQILLSLYLFPVNLIDSVFYFKISTNSSANTIRSYLFAEVGNLAPTFTAQKYSECLYIFIRDTLYIKVLNFMIIHAHPHTPIPTLLILVHHHHQPHTHIQKKKANKQCQILFYFYWEEEHNEAYNIFDTLK